MRKLNRHYLRVLKVFFVVIGILTLFFVGLWFSGWFSEEVTGLSGYQQGDEGSDGGMFVENRKDITYDIVVDFTEITGTARIQIYDTNCEQEELSGLVVDILEDSTLVAEIEVTEPQVVEIDLKQYPFNRCYYICVSGEADSRYVYVRSFECRMTRWTEIIRTIEGRGKLVL